MAALVKSLSGEKYAVNYKLIALWSLIFIRKAKAEVSTPSDKWQYSSVGYDVP